jgi:solute carrier family 6 (neurotransmitter transporter, noradrenalin) member 2
MQRSDGLQDIGVPKWQLAVCVFVVYCMLYLSLFKGVKSSGKFVVCLRLLEWQQNK